MAKRRQVKHGVISRWAIRYRANGGAGLIGVLPPGGIGFVWQPRFFRTRAYARAWIKKLSPYELFGSHRSRSGLTPVKVRILVEEITKTAKSR